MGSVTRARRRCAAKSPLTAASWIKPDRERPDGDGQDDVRHEDRGVDRAPHARAVEVLRPEQRPARHVGDEECAGARRRQQHHVAMPRHAVRHANQEPARRAGTAPLATMQAVLTPVRVSSDITALLPHDHRQKEPRRLCSARGAAPPVSAGAAGVPVVPGSPVG